VCRVWPEIKIYEGSTYLKFVPPGGNMNPVVVISIKEDVTDQELEDMLSEPIENGFYLAFMLGPHAGKYRVIFKRTPNYVDPAERAAEDEKAIALLKAHPDLALVHSVGLLAAKGIKRSRGWIGEQRSRMAFTAP
jgi:hypothetical protein